MVSTRKYTENGTFGICPADIYSSDDEFYYGHGGGKWLLAAGDYIVCPTHRPLPIGRIMPLKGVYIINKGYTIFKTIEILRIPTMSLYGTPQFNLRSFIYDHIVLDASMVEEDTLYQ